MESEKAKLWGVTPEKAWRELFEFDTEEFVTRTAEKIKAGIANRGHRGAVFGASGGIDSMVSAALCLRAKADKKEWRVVGLQMIDRRIKGETYNPELFERLGAELIIQDITREAIDTEKVLGMPPRWLTSVFIKAALSCLPGPALERLILAVKAGTAPRQVLRHFHLLLHLHGIRISRLRKFADLNHLMPVICANLTESLLGYFVEGGIDDPEMGECAPVSDLYKSQVIAVARYLRIPEKVIVQRPSPGFGGIHDEDIIGPYEIVDRVLSGISAGFSNREIARAIWRFYHPARHGAPLRAGREYTVRYIKFVRNLMESSLKKARGRE